MKTLPFILFALCCAAMLSCQKEFLEKKSDKALLVPTRPSDFQLLLDNVGVMNQMPALALISTDDYYTTDNGWKAYRAPSERNAYLWTKEVYEGDAVADWNALYQTVFYANVVLDGLEKLKGAGSASQLSALRGAALFYRSWAYFVLSQLYSPAYSAATADNAMGIPLKLNSDVNERPARGTLSATYQQITIDLNEALNSLPQQTGLKTQPDKCAAAALLSRAYLYMQDYSQAENYADIALGYNSVLLDFNTLVATAPKPLPNPFTTGNSEVVFYTSFMAYSSITTASALTSVDSLLYDTYHADDLRKAVFFNNKGNRIVSFKGSYTGAVPGNTYALFGGMATDELYLTRAECKARSGDLQGAIADLNNLLRKRYKTGNYTDVVATDQQTVLNFILAERRKELVARGTRWMDLKRLNLNPQTSVTLKRVIDKQEYFLVPNDPRYVFALPDNELINGKVMQNIR